MYIFFIGKLNDVKLPISNVHKSVGLLFNAQKCTKLFKNIYEKNVQKCSNHVRKYTKMYNSCTFFSEKLNYDIPLDLNVQKKYSYFFLRGTKFSIIFFIMYGNFSNICEQNLQKMYDACEKMYKTYTFFQFKNLHHVKPPILNVQERCTKMSKIFN